MLFYGSGEACFHLRLKVERYFTVHKKAAFMINGNSLLTGEHLNNGNN